MLIGDMWLYSAIAVKRPNQMEFQMSILNLDNQSFHMISRALNLDMFKSSNHQGKVKGPTDVYTLTNTQSQKWEDGNKGRKEEG